jgi:hypothetical protein
MQWNGIIFEVWLSGFLALSWLSLLIIRIFYNFQQLNIVLKDTILELPSYSVLLILIISAFSYALGWVINFIAESIFDNIFQNRYRHKRFSKLGYSFYEVRNVVYLNASNSVLDDLKYDRQLIRVSRANTFNFMMLSFAFVSFINLPLVQFKVPVIFALLFFILAIASFFQWRFRYKSTFKKFINFFEEIKDSIIKKEGVSNKCNLSEINDNKLYDAIQNQLNEQNKKMQEQTVIIKELNDLILDLNKTIIVSKKKSGLSRFLGFLK